jgi:hypothetical protein
LSRKQELSLAKIYRPSVITTAGAMGGQALMVDCPDPRPADDAEHGDVDPVTTTKRIDDPKELLHYLDAYRPTGVPE